VNVPLLQPKHLEIIGTDLCIKWEDGEESFIPLHLLRDSCPCASCQGEPDVLGRVVRPRKYDGSVTLKSYRWVGGYGFQPVWEDGHESGIFPYKLLKKLGA